MAIRNQYESFDSYSHIQRAPLCLTIYAISAGQLACAMVTRDQHPVPLILLISGVAMGLLAMSFHYLAISDRGDRLLVAFGPLPLFRRSVRYADIAQVEVARTTVLDGWGIHLSARGGWVWNIWGRDCVHLRLRGGSLWLGTDDPVGLVQFLETKISQPDFPAASGT